jgi:hypothetical protein
MINWARAGNKRRLRVLGCKFSGYKATSEAGSYWWKSRYNTNQKKIRLQCSKVNFKIKVWKCLRKNHHWTHRYSKVFVHYWRKHYGWTQSIEGKDLGPDPFPLLASLAACALSTLRMYIDRKGWDIPEINISLTYTKKAILNSLQQFQDQYFNRNWRRH